MLGVVVLNSGEPQAELLEPTASHLKIAHHRGSQGTKEPRPQDQLVQPFSDTPVPELVVTKNADPGGWEEREVVRRPRPDRGRRRVVGWERLGFRDAGKIQDLGEEGLEAGVPLVGEVGSIEGEVLGQLPITAPMLSSWPKMQL